MTSAARRKGSSSSPTSTRAGLSMLASRSMTGGAGPATRRAKVATLEGDWASMAAAAARARGCSGRRPTQVAPAFPRTKASKPRSSR